MSEALPNRRKQKKTQVWDLGSKMKAGFAWLASVAAKFLLKALSGIALAVLVATVLAIVYESRIGNVETSHKTELAKVDQLHQSEMAAMKQALNLKETEARRLDEQLRSLQPLLQVLERTIGDRAAARIQVSNKQRLAFQEAYQQLDSMLNSLSDYLPRAAEFRE